MHLTILHCLSMIYMFLEQYVYIRGIDQWFYKEVEFSQKVQALQIDCIQEQEVFSLAPTKPTFLNEPVIEPTITVLDKGAEDLWEAISKELQVEEEENYDALYNQLKGSLDEIYEEYDEDYLSISDMNHVESIEMDESYTEFATAKIIDHVMGHQQWTVQVIGIEQGYIHVSDGSGRLWLEVRDEKAVKLRNGNILVIDIFRDENKVHVDRIIRLDENLSSDYAIPDEDPRFIYEQLAM